MNKTLTVALTSVLAVIICAVMFVAIRSREMPVSSGEAGTAKQHISAGEEQTEEQVTISATAAEIIENVTETVSQANATKAPPAATRAENSTQAGGSGGSAGDTTAKPGETTAPAQSSATAPTEKPTETTTKKNVQTSSGTLAQDMTIMGLRKQGYDVYGTKKYIYNDDKNARQAKYGYNRFYDSAASLIDFHIETCRIAFKNYAGKDWMIQLWKGTYISDDEIGTVGCEIGLYNRTAGKYGGMFDHYNCAEQADWLNMEMTMLWDDDYDGNYSAQFTRTYDIYWWPTGFVDGQLRNRNDTSSIRVLGRITFKDSEMAEKFDAALSSVGFRKVTNFDPTVKDTYKRQICDVIFVWQDVRS
jgi:hypothetical protein